jgi:LmbE family N-acetylglucosaminyl deacetylase
MTTFVPSRPVAFISPHLDDAALSCGHTIAAHPGAHVITVFTAAPAVINANGPNEQKTGRAFAPDALQVRREEDAAAMEVLNAHAQWLGLHELEYAGANQDEQLITGALRSAIAAVGARSVIAPLGVHHPDHVAVSNACLMIATASALDWYLYLDMPYAQHYVEEKADRLQSIDAAVGLLSLEAVIPIGDVKRIAVEKYVSQLDGLRKQPRFEKSLSDPEHYWRLSDVVRD